MTMEIENLDSSLKSIYHRNQFRIFLRSNCELIKQDNKKLCTGCYNIFQQAYLYKGKYYCREICTQYEEIPM